MTLRDGRRPYRSAIAGLIALVLALAGCAAGPDYVRPAVELPPAYKEPGPWKIAEPQRADSRSPWWEPFGDPQLNRLIEQANGANQTLAQAEAQYRQAQAMADAARAAFWPGVGASAGLTRAQADSNGIKLGHTASAALSASWVPDLWGATRRAVEAGEAGAAASADQLAGARLGVQALLAQDYLQLRVTDRLMALYADTTTAYERALQLVQSQRAAGVALASDVALAESQLKTAAAQAVDLQAQRSQLEHAIAVLTGRPPAAFTLAAAPGALGPLAARLPPIPVGVPSQLLERRPDIAAAERLAAQANANIGVARAAFYPSLTLGASAGFSSGALSSLFDTPSHVWSLGATLAAALFDGGLRQARSAQASAAYDAAVAQYKQTVLAAFQQVEDNLALLRVLGNERALQEQAVEAAARAQRLALAQYRGGTATYLAVVTAQTLALANQRTAVQLQGRQLLASVALITATGGGWQAAAPGAPPAPIAARAGSSP